MLLVVSVDNLKARLACMSHPPMHVILAWYPTAHRLLWYIARLS